MLGSQLTCLEELGGVALLEDVCPWGCGFEALKAHTRCSISLLPVDQDIKLPASALRPCQSDSHNDFFKVALVLVSFYSNRTKTKTSRWHPLYGPSTVSGVGPSPHESLGRGCNHLYFP